LEQNEFVLHYQPQVDLRSNRIVGAEALVRWRHPEQGMISPASFIELAEETRLILALGEWALRTACTQNKAWVKSGLAPIPIAVNVSAHQFKHPGFTELVERALGESGLPAQLLELEITESVLMEDVSSTLEELRKMGITLAIDDFGTGFSGLSYLRDLPVDKLKIDQSFIRNISRMPDNEAITRAIVSIAKSMDLKILAEGVESSETAIFLLRLGCDEGQGYYFGKAVPADEFGPLLQRHARIEYSA
jgi:EAL domain-containing protein (putative c-di-GMP-specific phosphodiesterase class I)